MVNASETDANISKLFSLLPIELCIPNCHEVQRQHWHCDVGDVHVAADLAGEDLVEARRSARGAARRVIEARIPAGHISESAVGEVEGLKLARDDPRFELQVLLCCRRTASG